MKKLFCVLMCLCMAAGVVACAKPKPAEEKRELAHREIADDVEVMIIDNDGEIWLEEDNMDEFYVCYEESRGRFLEIRVDEKGEKQLKKAVKRKKRVLSLVINGEVMATPVTKHEYYDNCIVYEGEYTEIMACFNAVR